MDLQQGCSPYSEVILPHNKSSVEVAPARYNQLQKICE